MAIKFIKKSAQCADTIAFIPARVLKAKYDKAFPLNFRLVFQGDVPPESFLVNGKAHDMFIKFGKKEEGRQVKIKQVPLKFKFVKQNENQIYHFFEKKM